MPGVNEGSGDGAPDASKFLFKNTFKMTAKSVLLRPQGLRPRARAPLPPLLRPCSGQKHHDTIRFVHRSRYVYCITDGQW